MKTAALLTLLAAASAHAQDTRSVTEPVIPPACTILIAANAADDSKRIQDAIDHCAAGHSVRLAASNDMRAFTAGPLELRSGVTLVVEEGATLFASRDPRLFDLGKNTCGTIDSSGRGCRPFITLEGGSGAGIMGDGIIDGQGGQLVEGKTESWWQLARRAQKEKLNQNVPRLIQLAKTREFTLYRITLRNSPNFHVAMSGVDGFTAWAVKLDTPPDARNTDGIDPGSSRNVTIAHSFIRTGDDNIAIKGGNAGPVENISILHNHFYNGHGMSIGSETVSGVRRVLVDDLTMEGSVSGLRIKSDAGRGGLVNGVKYQNVCLRNVRIPIELITRYERRTEGSHIPNYQDIAFQQVYSTTPGRILIQGFDEGHKLGLAFDDVRIPGKPEIENAQIKGAIVDAPGACGERFAPFPAPFSRSTRPQLIAEQAAQYTPENVLKYVGTAGQERVDPWNVLQDPLASGAQFKPNYTVDGAAAANGNGVFTTVQAAIDHAVANAPAQGRVYIEVKPGVYHGLLYVPAAPVAITLYSNDPDATHTRVRADIDAGLPGSDYAALFGAQFTHSPASVKAMFESLKERPTIATQGATVTWIRNDGFQARNITFENYHSPRAVSDCKAAQCLPPRPLGRDSKGQDQAVAMLVDGADKVQFENARFIGNQDTLFLRSPTPGTTTRSFFHRSYVEGDVDFIFGDATAYFYRSEIKSLGTRHASSYVTAPSTSVKSRFGFVFNESTFTSDGSPAALAGRFYFARQWFNGQRCTPYGIVAGQDNYSCTIGETDSYTAPRGQISKSVVERVGKTLILNSRIGPHINKLQPWSDWNKLGALPYRPAQYDLNDFWRNLERAGIDPTRQLGHTRQPNQPFLAEYNNTDTP